MSTSYPTPPFPNTFTPPLVKQPLIVNATNPGVITELQRSPEVLKLLTTESTNTRPSDTMVYNVQRLAESTSIKALVFLPAAIALFHALEKISDENKSIKVLAALLISFGTAYGVFRRPVTYADDSNVLKDATNRKELLMYNPYSPPAPIPPEPEIPNSKSANTLKCWFA